MFFKKSKPAPAKMPAAQQDPFATIDSRALDTVAGGASRVSSRAGGDTSQLTTMLTQITDSIKSIGSQSSSGGMDPMMMMMMMMGMGGGGGGGQAAPAPAPVAPAAPIINVTTKRC